MIVNNVIESGVTIPSAVPGGILAGVIVLLGLTVSAKRLLEWRSVRYLVTSKEVYRKNGVVPRSVTNPNLNRIQNTTFRQSVTGRLLSHGHVHIETAGSRGTEVTVQNVGEPAVVVGHITRERDKLHDP